MVKIKENTRTFVLAVWVVLAGMLVAASQASAAIDYSPLTNGIQTDAQAGIQQVLPIVGFILAAIIVVSLIRKFIKAH